MSNKVKYINIKNQTYCFFNDIIDIENFDLNNIIKIHIEMFLFTILDM